MWRDLLDTRRLNGHGTLLEMLQHAAIVQVKVEMLVGFFAGRDPFHWVELGLAVRERKSILEEVRRVRAVLGDRPLQALEALQPLIGDTGKERRQ